ncbi:MAG: Rieske 2Fe-2S domain-containing protein [Alphaproteobacteria bacterium]|nr:Rieske 2Fe-2S domain-containing protein [Alphaproteobacteria bacterium]
MTPLCPVESIEDPGSAGFVIETTDGRKRAIMVVQANGHLRGYVNHCPHRGHPLDFTPGRFLDLTRTFVLCASHGALFSVETGRCLAGPCLGDGLEPVALVVAGGMIMVETT